ncbi:MAG: SDR family oxidoreductase [Novosphingobium sp.]
MRVIVTGGSSGSDSAAAHRIHCDSIARDGTPGSITLVARDRNALELAKEGLVRKGAQVTTISADLTDASSPEVIVSGAIAAFGGLDGVVSNAGYLQRKPILECDASDWDQTFAVNARATFLLAQLARPHLTASKGAFVAVGSIASNNPSSKLGVYGPSKAALDSLVRNLAVAWGTDGIRINLVSPGFTRTGMSKDEEANDTVPAGPRKTVLGRLGLPEDQAAAIAFLLGPDSRFITGTSIVVDGGTGALLMDTLGIS